MSQRDPIADVDELRHGLYQVVKRNAEGLPGPVVVEVLKSISEDMYAAGVDEALRMTEREISNWDNIASAWDLTWLTLFALKLKRAQNKKA